MPTVLRIGGYQFIIFTSDHRPAHIHIRRDGKLAKVRLDSIEFERTGGFNVGERSKILELVQEYQNFLLAEWDKLHPSEEA